MPRGLYKISLGLVLLLCGTVIIFLQCIVKIQDTESTGCYSKDCVQNIQNASITQCRHKDHSFGKNLDDKGPSSLMEQTRRHIIETVKDQWMFISSQIQVLQQIKLNFSSDVGDKTKYDSVFEKILTHGSDFYKVLNLELTKLAYLDGWKDWRVEEKKRLTTYIQEKISKLQNPVNCYETPPLICNLTNPNGFASGMHDVLWCFVRSYNENRRIAVLTNYWHYSMEDWGTLFEPLSKNCSSDSLLLDTPSKWPGDNDNRARWLMRTLPQDIGSKVIHLQGDPLAWWYGQLLSYLMRPNARLRTLFNDKEKQIDFTKPIVGIHVRRTDKVGTEARAHPLQTYMHHVENYFQGIELESSIDIPRRVYIATDEPEVLRECKLKYPDYKCLFNENNAEMASKLETRYSNSSLWSLMIDIFMLTKTDYLVCTLSSGICRLVYELKQALKYDIDDASTTVLSLDIPHHYAWAIPPARKAIYNHVPNSSEEIPFKIGDVLKHKNEFCTVNEALKGKLSNGYLKMTINQDGTEGFVPTFKTRKMFKLV